MTKVKILVPTDFSDCAHNALNYALNIAIDLNAEIVLLHCINSDVELSQEEVNKRSSEAKKKLDFLSNSIKISYPEISFETQLKKGLPEIAITSVIDKEKISFIVMGTNGESNTKASIMGSFTNNIILISKCPVFTIPLEANYKSIHHMVCATEMDDSELDNIYSVIEIAKIFKSHIQFYNVNPNKEEQAILLEKFKTKVQNLTDYEKLEFVGKTSDETEKEIGNFVCEKHPDVLVTLGKKNSFFDKLFGERITHNLCLRTTIPLLSFPSETLREIELIWLNN